MMVNPRVGQRVQIWYAKSYCQHMPLHGRIGVVVVANMNGKPRNHGVMVDGQFVVVPCGNLNKCEGGR